MAAVSRPWADSGETLGSSPGAHSFKTLLRRLSQALPPSTAREPEDVPGESGSSASHIQRGTIKQPVPRAGVSAFPRGGQGTVLAMEDAHARGAGRAGASPHLAPSCSLLDPHTHDSGGGLPKGSLLAAACLGLIDGLAPGPRHRLRTGEPGALRGARRGCPAAGHGCAFASQGLGLPSGAVASRVSAWGRGHVTPPRGASHRSLPAPLNLSSSPHALLPLKEPISRLARRIHRMSEDA